MFKKDSESCRKSHSDGTRSRKKIINFLLQNFDFKKQNSSN